MSAARASISRLMGVRISRRAPAAISRSVFRAARVTSSVHSVSPV